MDKTKTIKKRLNSSHYEILCETDFPTILRNKLLINLTFCDIEGKRLMKVLGLQYQRKKILKFKMFVYTISVSFYKGTLFQSYLFHYLLEFLILVKIALE